MKDDVTHIDTQTGDNEQLVNRAFSAQSVKFDSIYEGNKITVWMRDRFRQEILKHVQPGSELLELNCGTGIDTMFFANKGYKVTATDNADGMIAMINEKIAQQQLQDKIVAKKCSFNNLQQLKGNKFDYVYSNFGGLNCTDKLYEVIEGIDEVLKPGGYFTLVIMPRVCPWELLTIFKGHFKTAFRRFKKSGTPAHIEGTFFSCYYYNPSYVIKHAGDNYELCTLKGLAITVPPPFIEQFVENHPRMFRTLEKIENKISEKSPFNRWCDHYMITMKKVK